MIENNGIVCNNLPLISVIIPLFNHCKYVEQCLDSIKNNGWSRLELVVVDDGSTDASYSRLEAWLKVNSFSFERVITSSQKNIGITKTLNKMIASASGDFFVLIASDDYLLEGSIAERYNYLVENDHILAVFSDAIGVDDDGNKIFESMIQDKFSGNVSNLQDSRKITKELILNWCVPGPVFMARKEAYQELGGYDESYFIEDRYFYLKLLSVGRLGFINKSLAAYRLHATAMTGNKSKQILVGLEVLRIERNLKSRFSGINKFYMGLQIFSNYSQVVTSSGFIKPILFLRCLLAKLLKRLF
ncbi:MAG: glycosyltransferase [Pseudomonadaceae bacterium]|nr:glycosyltransferase [Pseudomonadaceae bacterium]